MVITTYVFVLLLLIEFTCLLALKVKSGYWLFNEKYNVNADLFEPHPYLTGMPLKNAKVSVEGKSYTHNSEGFRNSEIDHPKKKFRIIAMGGSTTYGTNVCDWETWPHYLDSLLPQEIEVLNFGVAGHSSIEHLIMASLLIPEYKPDLVLLHCGLNDLRNLFIKDLKSDYSDFHAPQLEGVLGFCYLNKLPRIAIIRVSALFLQKIGFYPYCSYQKIEIVEDHSKDNLNRALELYNRNLSNFCSILKNEEIALVMIPQILIRDAIEKDELKWWIPFVDDDELPVMMSKYNACMKTVATSSNCLFADTLIKYSWTKENFADASHLNAGGNLIFANILKDFLTPYIPAK